MPHQCVRCNTFYEDGANEILKGCKCGGKLFFYVKKEQIAAAKEISTNLSRTDKEQIEDDVYDIIGVEKEESDEPVVLDLESIRVLKPGKFEIDLVHLFQKGQPLVYKLDEGKYMIDIVGSFKKLLDDNDSEEKE
jgi:predicted  nucleic acid-binding Zn-ribbon protein